TGDVVVDPLVSGQFVRVAQLQIRHAVECRSRCLHATCDEDTANRGDPGEDAEQDDEGHCDSPTAVQPAGASAASPDFRESGGGGDGEHEPSLDVELEDRVHPVPDMYHVGPGRD